MVVLGIDTSTARAAVGVCVNGDVRIGRESFARSHVMVLPILIADVLRDAEISAGDIETVAVAVGPGSFSGLRVALGTARGLALATGAGLVGISTLEVLAASVEGRRGVVVPMLDARKGEVYSACFEVDDAGLRRLTDDRLTTIEDALNELPQGALAVGDAESSYGEKIRAEVPSVEFLPFHASGAHGSAVARLGHEHVMAGDLYLPPILEPWYLRPSEAEQSAINY